MVIPVNRQDLPGIWSFLDQERCDEKCPGKEVARGDPELCREVCVIADEDSHTIVGERVDESYPGHAEEAGADDDQVDVLPHLPGVPGDGEDCYRYSHGDEFDDRVKKKVVIEACCGESGEKHYEGDKGYPDFWSGVCAACRMVSGRGFGVVGIVWHGSGQKSGLFDHQSRSTGWFPGGQICIFILTIVLVAGHQPFYTGYIRRGDFLSNNEYSASAGLIGGRVWLRKGRFIC